MVGTTLSHYRILEELGRGGMGIVYKAEDTKLDRTVAVKVLPAAALSNEHDRARFYREAKAAAALNHPHIAAIHQIDEAVPEGGPQEDRRPFIAMEYIEGGTLEDRIRDGPLKLDEAIRIATQVAEALKAAHAKDIVHRDIKSANIMLTGEGQAKVLDFGLAQTAASTKLTRMGSTLGTVAYMSPEQARGEEVDARTDLWALGVVLYEMVAGRNPFGGDYEQAVVYSILNEDPEPLTAVRTGVPMALEWIVSKCLSKKADDRYQNATDLLVDLRSVDTRQAGLSNVLTHTSSTFPTAAAADRTSMVTHVKKSWPVLAGACLFAVALTYWVTFETEQAEGFRRLPLAIPGIRQLEDIHMSSAGDRIAFQGTDSTGRFGMYEYLLDGTDRVIYYEGSQNAGWPQYSPDGRFLAYGSFAGGYSRYEVGGSTRRQFPGTQAFWAEWLNNDEMVASNGDSLFTFSMTDGERTLLTAAEPGTRFMGVSDVLVDRQLVLLRQVDASGESSLMLYDVADKHLKVLKQGAHEGRFVGEEFVMFGRDDEAGRRWVVNVVASRFDHSRNELTGPEIDLYDSEPMYAFGVGEGTTMLRSPNTTNDMDVIFKQDVRGPGEQSLIVRSWVSALHVNLSVDGRSLLYVERDRDDEPSGIVIRDLESEASNTILRRDSIQYADWTNAGPELFFGEIRDGASRIMKVPVNRTEDPEMVFEGAHYFSVSPDGSALAVHGEESSVIGLYLFDPDSGESVEIDNDRVEPGSSFSDDGRYLAYSKRSTNGVDMFIRDLQEGGESIVEGGYRPMWDSDDQWLYFSDLYGTTLYRISFVTSPEFQVVGQPEEVLRPGRDTFYEIDPRNNVLYGVSARFTDLKGDDARIYMWENYDEYLRQRLEDR